jgi:hypothetical protein
MDQMIELRKLHDFRQENGGRPVVYLYSPTKMNSVNPPGITGRRNFFQMIELAENFVRAAQSKPVSKL